MKKEQLLLLMIAALIPLGTVAVHDATAEKIRVQASFYPYYDFTRNVAEPAATVDQFLPLGTEAHDWEPSIQTVQSLQNVDVFVYNGLGLETYIERLADSDDLSHINFVKASDGLILISTAGPDELIREALEEYEAGHYTAEEAIDAIKDIIDADQIQEILEAYRSGSLTTTEALSSILDLSGAGHADHDDHGHATDTDEHDEHGHDEHGHATDTDEHDEHGHDDHHMETGEIREILAEVYDGDVGYVAGLEAIRALVGSDGHGHDEHGHDDHHAHDHGAFDPHVWLDPVLAVTQVENIRDALMAADPANADIYQDNAAAYISELDELHRDFASALSNCQHDTIVTFHEAFAYLVERYGFEVVSLAGISGTETVTTANIVNLVEYVQANDIKYLLGDDILDTRPLEVIAEETDAQVLPISPIEGISPEEFESASYISKMRDNLEVIGIALACQ